MIKSDEGIGEAACTAYDGGRIEGLTWGDKAGWAKDDFERGCNVMREVDAMDPAARNAGLIEADVGDEDVGDGDDCKAVTPLHCDATRVSLSLVSSCGNISLTMGT